MNEEKQVIPEGWIETKKAARMADYTRKHVQRLANAGKIKAIKVGNTWLINRKSLLEYQANVKPGRPKERKS